MPAINLKRKIEHYLFLIYLLSIFFMIGCSKEDPEPVADCSNPAYDSSEQHAKGAQYQSFIDNYTDQGLPGISLLVNDSNGVWAGASGMANIAENRSMKTCHVTKVGSITKLFMGVLTFQLVEEGMINLENPIQDHLPDEVVEKVANAEEVTIRQLLNHTSGIYDFVEDQEYYLEVLDHPDKNRKAKELIEYVYNEDAAFDNGEDVGYSNTNYLLLSMVIENATGQEHGKLIEQKIIDQLGLENTYYAGYESLPPNTAHGYYDLYNNGQVGDLTQYNPGNGNGFTGIYATVWDLKTFIEALFKEKTLLSQTSLDAMLRFGPKQEDGFSYGLGVFKDFIYIGDQASAYGHDGRDLAYSAGVYYFPDHNVTYATIVNYGTNGTSDLKSVYDEYKDKLARKIVNKD